MCVCVEERTSHHVLFSLQKKMAFLRNLSLALALAGLAQGPDAQYVLVQVTQTKDAADSLCQAVGGALAVVATEDELIFLGRYIASLSSSASYVWLGGSVSTEAVPSWDDGTEFDGSFVPWGVSQPAASETGQTSIVMLVLSSSSSLWLSAEDSSLASVLCEIPYV